MTIVRALRPWTHVIVFVVALVGLRWGGVGWLRAIVLAYLCTYLDGSSKRGDRRWTAFQDSVIWRWLATYFPATLVVERNDDGTPAIDREGQYIFALHPHGVGSIGHVFFMTDGIGFHSKVFPAHRKRDLAASVTFILPIFRELILWLGNVDASRQVAEYFLKRRLSLAVYPGGEREQLRTQCGREAVVLHKTYGFIRLALRFGVPVVPTYTFGETHLYRTSSLFMGLRRALVHRLRVCVMLATGAYGTFWPRARRMVCVVGKPLHLGHSPNPTEAEVEAAHARYVEALVQLFDKHKDACCDSKDKTLHVM